MEVILLERVAKLGQIGDVVRVRDGFARNFLLPQGKALRATQENRARFETMKQDLEARNFEQKGEAEKVGKKLGGQNFTVLFRRPGLAQSDFNGGEQRRQGCSQFMRNVRGRLFLSRERSFEQIERFRQALHDGSKFGREIALLERQSEIFRRDKANCF